MAKRPWHVAARYFALIAMRWPQAFVNPRMRNTWLMWTGSEAGRIVGSVRSRTLYL